MEKQYRIFFCCIGIFLLFSKVSSTVLVHSIAPDNVANQTDAEEDGSDYTVVCYEDEVMCGNGEGCVEISRICDGACDCSDESDESALMNCSRSVPPNCRPTTEPNQTMNQTTGCDGESQYACTDLSCINTSQVCDGNRDCPDGKDELSCATTEQTTTSTADEYESCSKEEFECPEEGLCIELRYVCDKSHDCNGGEDELDCDFHNETSETTVTTTDVPLTVSTTDATAESTFSPRPSPNGPSCFYKNQHYPATHFIILSNNCTEVICSTSGKLLTWRNNQDASCDAPALKPTLTILCMILVFISLNWIS